MLEEKVTEVLDKLMELGETLSTPAFEAVVRGVQLEGMFSLIGGVVALLLYLPLAYFIIVGCKMAEAAKSGKEGPSVALVLISGAVTVVLAVYAPMQLLSSTNWIAAIDPVAEIARRIVAGG